MDQAKLNHLIQSRTTNLITLSAESDLLSVLHALVDLHLQNLPLPVDLPAVALLAAQLGVDPFALALALGAHRLDLLHHAGAELLNPDLHSGSAAGGAALNGTGFASDA